MTASTLTPPRSQAAVLKSLAAAILCIAIVVGPLSLGGTLTWACFGLKATMATAAIL